MGAGGGLGFFDSQFLEIVAARWHGVVYIFGHPANDGSGLRVASVAEGKRHCAGSLDNNHSSHFFNIAHVEIRLGTPDEIVE
jgi:hypothetical protein